MNTFRAMAICAVIIVMAVSCGKNSREAGSSARINDTIIIEQGQKSKPKQYMDFVTSQDGTKIAFEKSGSGPALIIVSGALSARSLFEGEPRLLVEILSKNFTVYIYDRRGRGESTDKQPYAVQREIDDLESLINHAGGQAYLYGVSSGGALALHATGKLGAEKVAKLAIFEVPYGQSKEVFNKQKQGVNDRIKNGKPGDAATFFLAEIGTPSEALEEMKASPAWRIIEKIDFTLAYDYEVLGDGAMPRDVVKTITIPMLVMVGEKSMDFMQATAEQLAKLTPDASHRILKGQTHQPKAEAVAPRLTEFFTR